MSLTLDGFVRSLSASGLMTADEVEAFLEQLPPGERPKTAEELVKRMFRAGKLTKFQAQYVYQGKARNLVLGNYVLLENLGAGGMGQVFKARHRRMKRVVALKVLPSAVAKSSDAVRRFQREVEAAAKLSHPNIVTSFDADESGSVHFLVMECVEGTDLSRLVRTKGTLTVNQTIDYVLQAARGLEYAHGENVVHRDIKPANLLLDRHGIVKILDMGLARFEREMGGAADTASAGLTHSGQVMGTIDYMSPEQALDTHCADARADIYSLGCTLFYLLEGRAVYGGETLAQKIIAHKEAPIPLLSALRPDVPRQLEAIFERMMAKRVEDRQQSMSQVILELEACQRSRLDAVAETASFRVGSRGGGETRSYAADGPLGELTSGGEVPAVGDWLKEQLPEPPTLFRLRPHSSTANRRFITLGAIVLGLGTLLLGVRLFFRTAEGTLIVEVSQPGATVEVDRDRFRIMTPASKEPVEFLVKEGQHTLRVTKGGFETFTSAFRIYSGRKEIVHVTLRPTAPVVAVESLSSLPPPPPRQEEPTVGPSATAPTPAVSQVEPEATSAQPEPVAPEPPPPAVSEPPKTDVESRVEVIPKPSPFIGPNGDWHLPQNAPRPAIAPFPADQGRRHREAWAKYLNEPIEIANSIGMKLVLIPPGEFLMGASDEEIRDFLSTFGATSEQEIKRVLGAMRQKATSDLDLSAAQGPRHPVRITRPFRLGIYAVTQREYQQVMGMNPSWFSAAGNGKEQVSGKDTSRYPVEMVTWHNAQEFCRRLSALSDELAAGRYYRLPTDAEWEYACRAGTTTRFYSGDSEDSLVDYAWCIHMVPRDRTGPSSPTAVGQKKANAWGLYDMHGNVFQLCNDGPQDYRRSTVNDPQGPNGDVSPATRGGCWRSTWDQCRSAHRWANDATCPNNHIGFRVVCTLGENLPSVTSNLP